jgi:hypothetical protein
MSGASMSVPPSVFFKAPMFFVFDMFKVFRKEISRSYPLFPILISSWKIPFSEFGTLLNPSTALQLGAGNLHRYTEK